MFLVLATVFLLTFACYKWLLNRGSSNNHGNYPPGPPFALPFLGHLLQLGTKPHLTYGKWRKTYGPVFSWKMASQNVVIVSDAKLMKELFSKEVAAGRIHSPIFDILTDRQGLITSEGRTSTEQRTFVRRTFKDLGVSGGSGAHESIILEEAQRLVKYLEGKVDSPTQVVGCFTGAILNNLWAILSGETHDWTKSSDLEHIKVFVEYLASGNRMVETGLMVVPWLRHVIPGLSGWSRFLNATTAFRRMVAKVVEKHKASSSSVGNTQDFIGQFLNHMEEVTDPQSSFYKSTGENNLTSTIGDLISAGADTTASALEFAMLYLSYHPQVQVAVRKELDTVIGSRLPCLMDKLPYLDAVILEVLRYASHVPIGFPRRVQADMEFHGYLIPKDTWIFPDHYNIQHDTSIWTDPEQFRPERFLNEDKSQVIRNESFIPFSVGRRNCVGENVAKSTLFLFLARLLQKFTVVYHGKEEVNLLDVTPGIVMKAKPFEVVFKLRD